MKPNPLLPCGAKPRPLAALPALVIGLGSFGLLLAAFDQASPRQWVAPSPGVLALVAQCQALPGRSQRDACAREVVDQARQRRQAELLLAQR